MNANPETVDNVLAEIVSDVVEMMYEQGFEADAATLIVLNKKGIQYSQGGDDITALACSSFRKLHGV